MKENKVLNFIQKKQNVVALCVCAAGVGLNLFFGWIIAKLGLPLYLDTVGTVRR